MVSGESPYTNFGVSGEIVFIMLVALILFGPRRMPEIARHIGRFMADFKNAGNALQDQIQDEMRKLELEDSVPGNRDTATRAQGEEASDAGEEVAPRAWHFVHFRHEPVSIFWPAALIRN